ncbi:MAG: hypothetical protein IKR40_09445 [Treponema sp.]|nr:hypothetical protein [Treponema sp.]
MQIVVLIIAKEIATADAQVIAEMDVKAGVIKGAKVVVATVARVTAMDSVEELATVHVVIPVKVLVTGLADIL